MNSHRAHRRLIALVLIFTALVAGANANDLQLVSGLDPAQVAPAGGGGDSVAPVLSANGRYVLFASTANNLLLTTNNTPMPAPVATPLNVFLRDRLYGTNALISVNLSGLAGGNADSLPVDVSTNGRFALFESSASDLVAADTTWASDVFVRDVINGTTLLVSVNTNGVPGNGASRSAVMTPDGRFVAFVSAATDLVPDDTNGIPDVFVRDLESNTTTLVSVGAVPGQTDFPYSSEAPDITPDGRYVAFLSTASGFVPGLPYGADIYLRDLAGGSTTWISRNARTLIASTNALCFNHAVSTDGDFVAYEVALSASGSSGPFFPGTRGIVVRYHVSTSVTFVVHTNAATSSSPTVELISAHEPSVPTVTPSGPSTLSGSSVSGDGRFVAFSSEAENLVPNDTNGVRDVFVRDLAGGAATLVSVNTNGFSGDGASTDSAISGDGRYVAFTSLADNLVPGDSNRYQDVFAHDCQSGTTWLVSLNTNSTASGNAASYSPSISQDGRFVVFRSKAVSEADYNGVLPSLNIPAGTSWADAHWLAANTTVHNP